MTEPKVVHEWDSGATGYKLYDDGSLKWEQVDIGSRSFCSGTLTASRIMREMARLAARVQELEEEVKVMERHELNEITRLREALKGVARYNAKAIEGILEAKP